MRLCLHQALPYVDICFALLKSVRLSVRVSKAEKLLATALAMLTCETSKKRKGIYSFFVLAFALSNLTHRDVWTYV